MCPNKKEFLTIFIVILAMGAEQKVSAKECKAPCVPFNVTYTNKYSEAILQPEYTDCTSKKKKKPHLSQGDSAQYCVDPKDDVRIEKWAGVGTNSSNVWGPTPVGSGWDLKCTQGSDKTVTCKGTPLKSENCRDFTVRNNALVKFTLQPEYTECVSKHYIKNRLESGEETYAVEAGTEVRVEKPYGPWSTINRWGPKNIDSGWVVDCPTSGRCTETPVK